MALKVQLSNERIGTINLEDDPIGLDKLEEIIKRSQENDGVVFQFSTNLGFVTTGREFIKQVYETDGIQALILCNIYEYDPNIYKWFLTMNGKLKLSNYKISETALTTNLDQIGFQVDFLNLMDKDVNFQTNHTKGGDPITDGLPQNLLLQPKTILKEYKGQAIDTTTFVQPDVTIIVTDKLYGQVNCENKAVDELTDTFTKPFGFSQDIEDILNENQVATEAGVMTARVVGDLTIFMNFGSGGGLGSVTFRIKTYLRHARHNFDVVADHLIDTTDYDVIALTGGANREIPVDYDTTVAGINVLVGDRFTVFFDLQAVAKSGGFSYPDYDYLAIKSNNIANTYTQFKEATTFPATTVTGIMGYELIEKLCHFYTNQATSFRSTALGRTDSSYAYEFDGVASKIMYSNGQRVRNAIPNPLNGDLFFNFKETMNSLACTFGLSWGFEYLEDGTPVVVVEEQSHFRNKDLLIMDLGEMPEVTKEVVTGKYYGRVTVGFPELKNIQQINAIDEFNTTREFLTPLTQVQGTLDLTSKIRASGYEIESQRRRSITTEDSPLDAEKFMISVLRNGAPVMGVQGWKNERIESFSEITGIYDPGSTYNLRLSPSRNIRRWGRYLAANVVKGDNKQFDFSKGTGNYSVVSREAAETTAVHEHGDLDLTNQDAFFVPEIYRFNWSLTAPEWEGVKARKYGYFKFKDKGVPCEGYLEDISRNPETKETKFALLKVYRT